MSLLPVNVGLILISIVLIDLLIVVLKKETMAATRIPARQKSKLND